MSAGLCGKNQGVGGSTVEMHWLWRTEGQLLGSGSLSSGTERLWGTALGHSHQQEPHAIHGLCWSVDCGLSSTPRAELAQSQHP